MTKLWILTYTLILADKLNWVCLIKRLKTITDNMIIKEIKI
jgi:hypothetical protein